VPIQPLFELANEARFTDAGLATDEHEPAMRVTGLPAPLQEVLKFVRTPDKRTAKNSRRYHARPLHGPFGAPMHEPLVGALRRTAVSRPKNTLTSQEETTMTTATFRGFSPKALRFLRDLARNNDRSWFTSRKTTYETELLEPLRALVADATSAMRRARVPLGADPRRSSFRIYRDIRFSPDKSPYKTNVAAFLARNGDREAAGGLYVHIQPKNSFLACGFYQLDKELLHRWREAMAAEPARFAATLRALERNALHLSEEHQELKRMPRGFEAHADTPLAKYFRTSSFIVGEDLTDDLVSTSALVDHIVDFAKRAKPLFTYGWALSDR